MKTSSFHFATLVAIWIGMSLDIVDDRIMRLAGALKRTASVARYIYNWGLERCQEHYQQHGKGKPWAELSAELTQLKQIDLWLYDFDSQMLQQAGQSPARLYQFLRAAG